MLLRKPIVLYYFSGTGNTLLLAKKIKEAFEKQKYLVTLKKYLRLE
jgi:flavodoxin